MTHREPIFRAGIFRFHSKWDVAIVVCLIAAAISSVPHSKSSGSADLDSFWIGMLTPRRLAISKALGLAGFISEAKSSRVFARQLSYLTPLH